MDEAYSSVIALTTKQWWLGGIMRSVHRYASDAMVLTMMLHMLRYFAFNLYHGFRWFGVTGVDADLDGLRLGHQRLHAVLGPLWRSTSPSPASNGWTGCPSSTAA